MCSSTEEREVQSWTGYWTHGSHRGVMDVVLFFAANHKITGGGTDEVGSFICVGECQGQRIHFIKQYIGQHEVRYNGVIRDKIMDGTWMIASANSRGTFHLELQSPRPTANGSGAGVLKGGTEEMQAQSWTGFWTQGSLRGGMDAVLFFAANQTVSGCGTDELGLFTCAGVCQGQRVHFIKQYIGQHGVRYNGVIRNNIIDGTWTIANADANSHGTFHLELQSHKPAANVSETGISQGQVVRSSRQGLREHSAGGDNLLQQLDRKFDRIDQKVDVLMAFHVENVERHCPSYVYFTEPRWSHKLIVKLLPQHKALRLQLLCEHQHGSHVIRDQDGAAVNFAPGEAKRIILPLIKSTFFVFAQILRTAMHVAAGMGDLVPNVGAEVALRYDSSTLSDYMGSQLPWSGADAQSQEEQAGAKQWLVNFLKDKNIGEAFKLFRVRYLDSYSIRWVCDRHRDEGYAEGILREFPVPK